MINKFKYSLLLLSLYPFNFCQADDESWLPQSIQIHGFLSQGFVHTSDNNFYGHSDDSISTDFRELGINGSWRALPELQLALQVTYRDAGQSDEKGLRIDYGLVDYTFYTSEILSFGVKAGRVPTPYGLYNDTRDVARTRPSILLPQSIYFDVNRNLAISGDGGYFYGEYRSDFGDFSLIAEGHVPRTDDPSFKYGIVGDFPGEMEGNASWLTQLNYEWQNGRVRLGIGLGQFNSQYQPDENTFNFDAGKVQSTPLILSAQYNAENWSFTSEYVLRNSQVSGFGLFPDSETTGESFYFQGTYQLTAYLEALLRYDYLVNDRNDRDGSDYAAETGRQAHSNFAKDWTIGLRAEVLPRFLISAEYHRVNGTAWVAQQENPNGTTQHWDLFLMMLSYDF